MIRFYSPIFLLQVFCLYHAYSNKAEQKWYLIIMFFPFIGSVFYLYKTFYSRRNLDDLTEEVKNTFVTNYKIEKLEKELKFSNTVSKRIELADEYSLVGNYDQALELYKSCLEGIYEDDPKLLMKLVKNSYLIEDYPSTISYGKQIRTTKSFNASEEKIAFAWANYHENNIVEAEQCFKEMDIRFSNYKHRLEYANFLNLVKRKNESQQILEALLEEIDSMDKQEKRSRKVIHQEIKNLYNQKTDQ